MKKIIKNVLVTSLLWGAVSSAAEAAVTMKNPLSVHVLNLKTGVPSEGVTVTLDKKEDDKWVRLSSAVTSKDGRINALYPIGQDIQPGDYRVTFETGQYYAAHKEETIFPEIPVIIHVSKAGEYYHVPLLLSQYGYSTYRGS
jgi:5-hydroxyisourate hydrolase